MICPYRGDELDNRHLRLMGDLGQISFLRYDLRDPDSVAKCVKYSNIVVNLVGRDYETRNFKFPDVHVNGAHAIAKACQSSGVDQLIHFSALNASEDSPSEFLQSKALGEQVVREVFPDATIMRPANVFGAEDRFLNYYASLRLLPLGFIPIEKRGTQTYKQPVYVIDVAKAVLSAMKDPSSKGQTYELIGPKQHNLHDLVEYIYAVTYRPFKPYSPPKFMARLVARILEMNPFIPYMTRDIWTRLHLSDTPHEDLPGLEDLGVTPTPLEDVAIATVRRYRDFYTYNKPIDDVAPIRRA